MFWRLVVNGDAIGSLTQDLDSDERYIFCTVSFLQDVGWLKQEPNGEYIITNRGINHGHMKTSDNLGR
jgi:hypothetical protein